MVPPEAASNGSLTLTPNVLDALKAFHKRIQKETLPDTQKQLASQDFASLLKYMGSADGDAVSPPSGSEYGLPLSSYFISTSHNTYLTGHQLYGQATVDGYKNVTSTFLINYQC
jgi:hypothetical protein